MTLLTSTEPCENVAYYFFLNRPSLLNNFEIFVSIMITQVFSHNSSSLLLCPAFILLIKYLFYFRDSLM